MNPLDDRRPEAAATPALTPAEAAERLQAAGYRVRHRSAKRRRFIVHVPSLLPYLFAEHGPQTLPEE
jgi:hypothetical protein